MASKVNRLPLLWAEFCSLSWCLEGEKFRTILGVLQNQIEGKNSISANLFEDDEEELFGRSDNPDELPPYVLTHGAVSVMKLHGTLSRRQNLMTHYSGGTSMEMFGKSLDLLVADKSVRTIVISVNSPGGSYQGLPELGDKIFAARKKKRIVALADDHALSAAYWLASQATKLFVTPSAEVGSIGVYRLYVNRGPEMQERGREPEILRVPDGKNRMSGVEPLDKETREYELNILGKTYEAFLAVVARGRKLSVDKIRETFGNGREFQTEAAVELGMADGVRQLQDLVDQEIATMTEQEMKDEIAALKAKNANLETEKGNLQSQVTEQATTISTQAADLATARTTATELQAQEAQRKESDALAACEREVASYKHLKLNVKKDGAMLRNLDNTSPEAAKSLRSAWKDADLKAGGANLNPSGSATTPTTAPSLQPPTGGGGDSQLRGAAELDRRVAEVRAKGNHDAKGKTSVQVDAEIAADILLADPKLAEEVARGANPDLTAGPAQEF